MKKLLRYFKQYCKEVVLAPLFKLTEAVFELFVPLVVADMIDVGIRGDLASPSGYLVRRALLLVLLGVVGLLCAVSAQYFAAKAAVGFSAGVRGALFRKMQHLSMKDLDTLGESTGITRVTSDVDQLQSGVNLTLRLFLRSPFIVFGAMIMAFAVDASSAVVFAVVIPVLALVVFGILLWTMPMHKTVRGKLDGVLRLTKENLDGVRVIRSFGHEAMEKERFAKQNTGLTALQQKVGRLSALLNPLTYVILNLAVIFLLQKGALRVEVGALSSGEVVALYNYMSQILVELIKLANLILTMTKAMACASRVEQVLSLPDAPTGTCFLTEEDLRGAASAVEFRGVSVKYHEGGDYALSDVSLTVAPGETVGILGGTGSGKSTLVNLIPGFYSATDGEVLVFGRPVKEWRTEDLRKRIGVVPQKAQLFSGSIRENLKLGCPDADDAALDEAILASQSTDVVEAKGGLDAAIEQSGRNLSGGQKQRLTIARALVRRPAILILDDSGSALDYATDRRLREAIASLNYRPTVFLVSQRPAGLVRADRIVVLDDGEVKGIGTHSELLACCDVYREIWESQSDGKECSHD